jgi:hypothetical protein
MGFELTGDFVADPTGSLVDGAKPPDVTDPSAANHDQRHYQSDCPVDRRAGD